MKRFIVILALLVPFASYAAMSAKELSAVAKDVNKRTPLMIDDDTRLEKVKAKGNKVLKYQYTMVNYTGAQFDIKKFRGSFKDSLTRHTCSKMKKLLNDGVTIVYNYKAKDGKFLTEVKVNSGNC